MLGVLRRIPVVFNTTASVCVCVSCGRQNPEKPTKTFALKSTALSAANFHMGPHSPQTMPIWTEGNWFSWLFIWFPLCRPECDSFKEFIVDWQFFLVFLSKSRNVNSNSKSKRYARPLSNMLMHTFPHHIRHHSHQTRQPAKHRHQTHRSFVLVIQHSVGFVFSSHRKTDTSKRATVCRALWICLCIARSYNAPCTISMCSLSRNKNYSSNCILLYLAQIMNISIAIVAISKMNNMT